MQQLNMRTDKLVTEFLCLDSRSVDEQIVEIRARMSSVFFAIKLIISDPFS